MARFLPRVAAFMKEQDGAFPATQDPLLAECVLFCATFFAVKIGRETVTDTYEKWAKTQGLTDTHLTDKELSDVFMASGLPWICPATRVLEEEQKRAAGTTTTSIAAKAAPTAPFKRGRAAF